MDDPGFNDPDPELTDSELWLRLVEWFRTEENEVLSHGYAGFINIVSIPVSKRPAKDSYMNVAKLLMSLTLVYPSFPMEDLKRGKFPKIYTILTNFSPLVEEDTSQDGVMDYGAEEDAPQEERRSSKEWYEELKKQYILGVSACVYELFECSKGVAANAKKRVEDISSLPPHVRDLLLQKKSVRD